MTFTDREQAYYHICTIENSLKEIKRIIKKSEQITTNPKIKYNIFRAPRGCNIDRAIAQCIKNSSATYEATYLYWHNTIIVVEYNDSASEVYEKWCKAMGITR